MNALSIDKTSFVILVEHVSSEDCELSNEKKIRMDLLIVVLVLAVYFLLSLPLIIYQRHLIHKNYKQKKLENKYGMCLICYPMS